jgi:hypothetical protein
MGVSVVRGESAVGVPLRQLFRYECMDVTPADSTLGALPLSVSRLLLLLQAQIQAPVQSHRDAIYTLLMMCATGSALGPVRDLSATQIRSLDLALQDPLPAATKPAEAPSP